jgi:hypothetical protein
MDGLGDFALRLSDREAGGAKIMAERRVAKSAGL